MIPYAPSSARCCPRFARSSADDAGARPGLTDLPPVSLEAHIASITRAYPSDPGTATAWSDALRHCSSAARPGLDRRHRQRGEPLPEASADATNAKILFLLLGIPGALVAAALGLAAQSALAEAQRREDGLLRLRGATEAQSLRLAAAKPPVAGVIGRSSGCRRPSRRVSAVEGERRLARISRRASRSRSLAAVGIGVATTAFASSCSMRASRRSHVVAERRMLERGWRPLWLRGSPRPDRDRGRLPDPGRQPRRGRPAHQNPIAAAQGRRSALSFYVLLAPIALWIGLTLCWRRGSLLAAFRRWTRPDRAHRCASWRGPGLRCSAAGRPGRGRAGAGILAVAFGTEVVTFVATYGSAKRPTRRRPSARTCA